MLTRKNFSSFEEQVEWLKDEKNIIIEDTAYAEKVLQRIGYFSLMGGSKSFVTS